MYITQAAGKVGISLAVSVYFSVYAQLSELTAPQLRDIVYNYAYAKHGYVYVRQPIGMSLNRESTDSLIIRIRESVDSL